MATAATLQAAVHKATTPNWDAAPEEQEGDPIAMVEVTEAVINNPKLTADLVKFVKARIKDQNTQVTFIALDVLDQCMESLGFQCQALVQKKVLERIGKIATPGAKGIPEMVRSKAATCITMWGDRYGSDPRLDGFKKAALMVQSREVKDVREAFSEEIKEMKELKEAARVANEADAAEIKDRMREMGVEPKEPAPAPKPAKRGFFSRKPKVDKKKAAEAAAQLQQEEVEARNKMTYVVLMGRAKEASETLGAIIEGSTVEELQENEAAHEVVVTCMKYQTHLEVLASSVTEDDQVAQCIAMNEELSERINLYEQFVTGQAQPGELLSVPIPRVGSGAAAAAGGIKPAAEELRSTLSDASAIFKGQITTAGLPPPDYSDSDEDDDTGADLINLSPAPAAAASGDAGNLFFGGGAAASSAAEFNKFSKEAPKVDELYKPSTTESELKDVFGAPEPPATDNLFGAPEPPAVGREVSNVGADTSNPFGDMMPPSGGGGGGGGGASLIDLYHENSGVLFENGDIKIELSHAYTGTEGTLSMKLVNVGARGISGIQVDCEDCDGQSTDVTPPLSECAAGSGVPFKVAVRTHGPNMETVALKLSYDDKNLTIPLPSVVTKFMSPLPIDKDAFDGKFDGCGMSLGDVIMSSDRWKSPEDVRKVVAVGLNMAIVPISDNSSVIGSGTYPGEGGPVECFVKLEGVSEGTYLMDIRSTDDKLKNAVEKVVKDVLAST